MRTRTLVLATSAILLAAPALAQTPPPPPVTGTAPTVTAACQAGSLGDGTYQAAERERRNRDRPNRPNRQARNNDNADNAGSDNADDDANAGGTGNGNDASGTGITEVTLTWQCGGAGPGGAYIPTGYKVVVRGECPSGTCDLGTTVAIGDKEGNVYAAFLDDETVGFRELRFQSRRNRVMLNVRTQVEGQRRPSQARYVLSQR